MTYIVKPNDTFELISRSIYGTDSNVQLLRDANPGADEPLPTGIVLITPPAIDNPLVISSGRDGNVTQVFIDGIEFSLWSSITIETNVDGFSQASFIAPFEESNLEFRGKFKPFSFAQVIIAIDQEFMFFGYMLTAIPTLDNDSRIVTVNCYSRAAMLSDCTFPFSSKSFEFNKLKFDAIAKRLCGSLALRPIFEDDVGGIFKQVTAKPSDNAAQFLIKLANQRGLLLADNEDGQPVFRKSVIAGNPVAVLEQGKSPLLSVVPSFNAQAYYSHISAIAPVDVGSNGLGFTAKNSKINSIIKPFTFEASETEGADLPAAVIAKAGRMYADAASWTITLQTWRDPLNRIWRANTTIKLLAPGAMVYSSYEFTIRKVVLQKNNDSEIAILSLILPGALRGEIPKVLPWEELAL